ncbi:hypothetical protein DDQ41_29805 [Streptomyces spongiicola]|uniref:Uncharacterized protein n=1 Tax=Streptomyces spongiicola TaxID=1690221 RepID=A0ABM6VDX5_9ACTN|nr:hypothetical protein DDQ41_29805 [Streptomyces spongiicola]
MDAGRGREPGAGGREPGAGRRAPGAGGRGPGAVTRAVRAPGARSRARGFLFRQSGAYCADPRHPSAGDPRCTSPLAHRRETPPASARRGLATSRPRCRDPSHPPPRPAGEVGPARCREAVGRCGLVTGPPPGHAHERTGRTRRRTRASQTR